MEPFWNTIWNNPPAGGYQPFPGIFGNGVSGPPVWGPPPPVPVPPQDSFQPQPPQDANASGGEQKSAWSTFGKEVLKTGVTIGASVLGGIFGGIPGAVAAGAITSGVVSAIDQQASKGKVDWGSVAIDTLLGTIPGGVGTAVVRAGEKGIAKLAARTFVKQTGERSLKRAAAEGAADGALMGYVGGALQSGYEEYKDTGHVNFAKANAEGFNDMVPGLLGGAAAGSLFTGLGRYFHQKRQASQYAATINTPTPDHLKDLKPPKISFANRMSAMFLQKKSGDPLLGNFRRVDDHVFRGGMPETPAAFHRLKNEHKVRTIIDLRGLETTRPEHIDFEKAWAAEKGLRHVWIPMKSTQAPTQEELQRFFHEVEKARLAGGNVYVHCKHGIDRTGSIIAAYDVSRGVKPAEAFRSMRENGYNFMHERSRPAQKAFVLNGDLPEAVRMAQAGVQIRNEAKALLRNKVINQDELDKLVGLLHSGNIVEAEMQLSAKAPGRKTVFVPKAVETPVQAKPSAAVDGDHFHKSAPVSKSPKPAVAVVTGVESSPLTPPAKPSIKPPVKPSTESKPPVKTSSAILPPPAKPAGGATKPIAPKKQADTGSKVVTSGSTAAARVMTAQELFGPNLANVHFRQNGNNTCYLLSSLDGILRHPDGHKILNKIRFEKTANGYTVGFPGQPQPITVSNRELALGGVSTDSIGLRLIERAYLKIPAVRAGEYDQPTRALERIFGWRMNQGESISLHSDPNARQFIGGVEFGYAERKEQLQQYLRQRPRESGHTDADIVTAISKNGGNHYYSVRLNASTPEKIVLADPFNTRDRVRQVNIDDLLKDYHLEGIRLPVN